jgi:hypothetical protein
MPGHHLRSQPDPGPGHLRVRLRQQLPVRAAAGPNQLLLLRDDLRRDDMPFTLDDLLLVRAGWGPGYHVLRTGDDLLHGGQ